MQGKVDLMAVKLAVKPTTGVLSCIVAGVESRGFPRLFSEPPVGFEPTTCGLRISGTQR